MPITLPITHVLHLHHGASARRDRVQLPIIINDREAFRATNFTGDPVEPGEAIDAGWLDTNAHNLLRKHTAYEQIDYVIRSYGTPIAYHCTDGQWVLPGLVKDTQTTGNHRRWAIGALLEIMSQEV